MCLLLDYIMFKSYPCECNVFTNWIILCLNHTLVNVMCLLQDYIMFKSYPCECNVFTTGLYYV